MGEELSQWRSPDATNFCVLDACVLVPVSLTDTLLRCAERGLFTPVWSTDILNELTRALEVAHPHHPPEFFRRRLRFMNEAFPDAMRELEHTVGSSRAALPDPNDQHVLELAVQNRAGLIVTFNLRDFPEAICARRGVRAIHPSELLKAFASAHATDLAKVLSLQASDTHEPSMTVSRVLASLGAHVPDFVTYWSAQSDAIEHEPATDSSPDG